MRKSDTVILMIAGALFLAIIMLLTVGTAIDQGGKVFITVNGWGEWEGIGDVLALAALIGLLVYVGLNLILHKWSIH